MSRRVRAEKRQVTPDVRYNSVMVADFVNRMMRGGKKSVAYRVMYGAFDLIEERAKRPPLEVFEQAMKNATPVIEVKPRRVGGSTYQVPVEVPPDRRNTLALRWLLQAARARCGQSRIEHRAYELHEGGRGYGAVFQTRAYTH